MEAILGSVSLAMAAQNGVYRTVLLLAGSFALKIYWLSSSGSNFLADFFCYGV
jgi:hypothetical protein